MLSFIVSIKAIKERLVASWRKASAFTALNSQPEETLPPFPASRPEPIPLRSLIVPALVGLFILSLLSAIALVSVVMLLT